MSAILLLISVLAVVNVEGKTPCKLDLAFLVDGSSSICDGRISDPCSSWKANLQFIKNIVKHLTIGPEDTKVAFVNFGNTAELRWNLNEHEDEASVLEAIDAEEIPGGELTSTASFSIFGTQVFNAADGDRDNVPNVVIMTTDDFKTTLEEAEASFATLQQDLKVKVMLVCANTTSSKCDEQCVQLLSSYPHEKGVTYFMANEYILIETVRESLEKNLCVFFKDPKR